MPSLNYMPLRLQDEQRQQQQQQQRGGGGGLYQPFQQQQQPQVFLSAAEELAADKAASAAELGESNEELVLRRTREFNAATRERPHDLQLWLRFADFQVGPEWLLAAGCWGLRLGVGCWPGGCWLGDAGCFTDGHLAALQPVLR